MNTYRLKIKPKTRFFNFFRRLFTIPFLEKLLVTLVLKKSFRFFKKLIPPDYLYKKNSFRYVKRGDINYKLDISNVVDHFLYFGIKDANYDSILDSLKNSKIILDIGSNIGNTSLFFASINPMAQIFAFEPHPEIFEKANENIKANKFQNIQLLNIGLGA